MFPFCAEDCDVVGICCHIDEDHAVEVKNGKFQGFLHTAAMTVRAKFIELFLDLKSKIEEHVRVHGLVLSQTFPCSLPRISFFQICNQLERHVFALVLDLNETLVYFDWKDSKLNRNLPKILYVSGHALESSLQPKNCIPVRPWKLEADEQRSYSISEFQVG